MCQIASPWYATRLICCRSWLISPCRSRKTLNVKAVFDIVVFSTNVLILAIKPGISWKRYLSTDVSIVYLLFYLGTRSPPRTRLRIWLLYGHIALLPLNLRNWRLNTNTRNVQDSARVDCLVEDKELDPAASYESIQTTANAKQPPLIQNF